MDQGQARSLRRALGLGNLVLFGLVAVGPIAGITMYGFVAERAAGAVVPAYLTAAAGICLSALSFATMAEAAPGAGSVYGYAAHGIGPWAGVIGGWAMLLDYVLLNALVIVFGAYYVVGALPDLPLSLVALGFGLFSLVMALRGILWSSKVDGAITLMQVAIVLAVVLGWQLGAGVGGEGTGSWSADLPQIWPDQASGAAVLAGASNAIIAFLGFDAISTLAEEVRSEAPGRAIGTATVLTVGAMAATFIATGLALAGMAPGLGGLMPETAGFQIVAARFGWMALPLGLGAGIAIGMGANLACTLGASRILYALGRDGHLPAALARVHGAWHTPWVAVLTVSALAGGLALMALDQAAILADLVSFGALTGFLAVNLSVLIRFGLRAGSRRWLRHWILPAAGAAVVLYTMSGISRAAIELGLAWIALGLVVQAAMRHPIARRRVPGTGPKPDQ